MVMKTLCSRPAWNAVATLLCSVATATFGLGMANHLPDCRAASPREDGSHQACRVVGMAVFPDRVLVSDDPAVQGDRPVVLGGLSDLAVIRNTNRTDELLVSVVTDRGPTSKLATPHGKRRVVWNPAFLPTILTFSVTGLTENQKQRPLPLVTTFLSEKTFYGLNGRRFSGHPLGLEGDEPAFPPDGQQPLQADPNGIDPEGLALLQDGSAWVAEEHLPSLMRITANGMVTARYVPNGLSIKAGDTKTLATLPAHYRQRQPNRGFEAVAVSPDESVVWTMLQSPLMQQKDSKVRESGLIRMLQLNARTGQPLAEYIYRLGDPTNAKYRAGGNISADGKICAMSCVDAESLIVLEQSDDGDAAIYRCKFGESTNTLGDNRQFEGISNLSAAGVVAVEKTLVTDLRPLLGQFAQDITAGAWKPEPGEAIAGLKLEGMVIIDQRHIAVINDNDFNVDATNDPDEPFRRSCLWIIALPTTLEWLYPVP